MENIIKISTKEELLGIKKNGSYILVNDIDLEGVENTIINKFEGQFDGQGFTLRNIQMFGDGAYTGLFNTVTGKDAKISNLVVENAIIIGYKACGIIAGFLSNGATIENCTVKVGDVSERRVHGAGLICGKVNDYNIETTSYIRNCKVIDSNTDASAIAGRACYCVIEDCLVENCELIIHAGCLIYDISDSFVRNCFVQNCKLSDKSGTIISEAENTQIINTELIVPKIETNEVTMKRILESSDSYEQLKDKEEISLWGIYTNEPVDFPEVITKLTLLKKLNIGNNLWRSIPDIITNLQNLEELQLDCSLSCIQKLPDLSKLSKLRILRANGNAWLPEHNFPDQSLLPQILKASQVEQLDLSKWGERIRKAEVVRRQPEEELFNGLKDFKNLKMLILSNNSLETVPEALYHLSAEYIDLSFNWLAGNHNSQLRKSCPNTVFNFERNEPRKAEENMNELCQYGAQLILNFNNQEKLFDAVDVFNKIIENIEGGVYNDDPFTIQYAYYGKLYAYIFLTAYHKSKFGDKPKQEEAVQTMLNLSRQVIRLVKENREILAYSDLASLQADMIRRATNTLGWHAYQNSKDKAELEEAAELTQWGTEYIEDTDHFYIYDTLVRLLIKMKRKDEAYAIVKSTLKQYPGFGDFADFRENKEYNKWLSENE